MFDPNAPQYADKGGDFTPVGPGEKLGAVVRISRGQTANGKPTVELTWVILADRVAPRGEKGDGTKLLFDTVYMNPESLWRFAQLVRATGQSAPFDEADDDALSGVLTQAPVVLTVENEEYNGKTRAKVRRYARFGGTWDDAWDKVVSDGEERAEKAAAKRAASLGGGATATPSRQAASSGSDDPLSGGGGVADDDGIPF